jgi:multidrug efflux system membrane fusion protein
MEDRGSTAETVKEPTSLFFIAWTLGALAVLGVTVGIVLARERFMRSQQALRMAQVQLGPRVLVKRLSFTEQGRVVKLPAEIHGYLETPIYAKVSGFVQKMLVDKGDWVKQGQLLAIIEAPELNKQLANALASYKIMKITNDRYQALVRNQVISQQDADQAEANYLQAKATLQQLRDITRYEEVRAPYAGMISARNVDPGVLVAQSSSAASSAPLVAATAASPTPLLTLALLDTVRVYAYMPQSSATYIKDGDPAVVTVAEYPGRTYKGVVTRHPAALMSATRTMLVEVDLANKDHSLLPGMYAEMAVQVSVPKRVPRVPDDILIFNNGKVFVPTVDQNRIHLAEVTLGYDDGRAVEVTQGLSGQELLAMNVGQSAREGERVQPIFRDGAQGGPQNH